MQETWYVLADGRAVDPCDVGPDVDGVLRHKDGVPVAVGPHGPRSRGVDAAAERAKAAAAQREAVAAADGADAAVVRADRQMTAKSGGARYKTR